MSAELPHVAHNSKALAAKAASAPYYIARSSVCVNAKDERIGNGLFAGSSFEGGKAVVTLKRPLAASLESERLIDTCANCYVWTEGSSIGSRLYVKGGTSVSMCAGCKRFRYCSKTCQKEAWNRGHKHECKNLKPVSDKEIPKAVLGCMELLVRRKHGLISDEMWALLCQLDAHVVDFQRNGKYGGIELMALGTSRFSFTQDTFSKEFVAAMYARILSNSLTLITPTFDPLGIIIDPIFCHINHSCDPNAYVVMDGPRIELRALRSIKKNEEIYIAYTDPTNPFARRQSDLLERWFFECRCIKCRKGATQQEDEWAISFEDIATKHKEVADVIIQRTGLADDPANFVEDSVDGRRVAALQGDLFRLYEDEQRVTDYSEAIDKIEFAMSLCHQSGLWPYYRQPFAALRDDLFVNLLAVGRYEEAWAHCAKRHRYITPKLYPQQCHPVRVVQTWQMAMLAQYLAGTGKEVAPGVDMAVIAAALINIVNAAAKTSHGPDSAFFKSVHDKFTEVEAEVLSKLGSKDVMNAALQHQERLLANMGDLVPY